jgi:hypothetical protein
MSAGMVPEYPVYTEADRVSVALRISSMILGASQILNSARLLADQLANAPLPGEARSGAPDRPAAAANGEERIRSRCAPGDWICSICGEGQQRHLYGWIHVCWGQHPSRPSPGAHTTDRYAHELLRDQSFRPGC